jgi:hypothetical protein
MGAPRFDPKAPLNLFTANAMLQSVRVAMDDRAWELFELWFRGKAPPEVTFATPAWAEYMRADQRLASQIRMRLEMHAEGLRDKAAAAGSNLLRAPFALRFHAETGSKQGGYVTGYEVLHGTNASAGDFEVEGFCTIRPGKDGAYTVNYDTVAYTFNDIVDANKRWSADVIFARTAANMAAALRTGPPRDYRVKIRWTHPGVVTIPVAANVPGKATPWLRTFENR